MKNIILSTTEKHPISANDITIDPIDRRMLVIFGLARRRGDNIYSTTRFTDNLSSMVARYDLTLYQIPETDPVMPQEQARADMAQRGVRADFVGLSYNIRKAWGQEKYKTFLTELYEALA